MKKHFAILFICLFVVMIGYGITLPILPFYIERLASTDGSTLQKASLHVSILTSLFALMQFFFAPLWGRWSDKIGRRTVILIGLAGYAVSMVLFGLGTNLKMLYLARILGGILSSALLPVANAYVADLTSEASRSQRIAELNTAIGLGLIVGPILGALLPKIGSHAQYRFGHFCLSDFSNPFLTASILAIVALSAALVSLPESFRLSDIEPLLQITPSGAQPNFILKSLGKILFLSSLSQLSLAMFEGTFILHSQKIMKFGPGQLSLVFVVCGSVMTVAQATIVTRLMKIVGENSSLRIGFGLLGIGLILLMTSQTISSILAYVSLLGLGMAVLTPTLAVLVTKKAREHIGRGLGLQGSANSLGQTFGPLFGGLLLTQFIHVPYLIMGLLSLGIAMFMRKQD